MKVTIITRCPECGRKQKDNGLPNYCCGKKVDDGDPEKQSKIDSRGYDKAEVCRSGQCGMYEAATDTCRILTAKKEAGAIAWMYDHPDAHCVHPTDPQF